MANTTLTVSKNDLLAIQHDLVLGKHSKAYKKIDHLLMREQVANMMPTETLLANRIIERLNEANVVITA